MESAAHPHTPTPSQNACSQTPRKCLTSLQDTNMLDENTMMSEKVKTYQMKRQKKIGCLYQGSL